MCEHSPPQNAHAASPTHNLARAESRRPRMHCIPETPATRCAGPRVPSSKLPSHRRVNQHRTPASESQGECARQQGGKPTQRWSPRTHPASSTLVAQRTLVPRERQASSTQGSSPGTLVLRVSDPNARMRVTSLINGRRGPVFHKCKRENKHKGMRKLYESTPNRGFGSSVAVRD